MENKTQSLDSSKEPLMRFKSFVLLFFQDSIQGANKEIQYQKDLRKFYMKSLRQLLPMTDEQIEKHCKQYPELNKAYEEFINMSEGKNE